MEHRFDICAKFKFSRVPTGGIVLINTPSAVLDPPVRETNSPCARTMHQDRHPSDRPSARTYLELTRRR